MRLRRSAAALQKAKVGSRFPPKGAADPPQAGAAIKKCVKFFID